MAKKKRIEDKLSSDFNYKKNHEVRQIALTDLEPDKENPNEQSDKEFNMLCEDIEANGFVEYPQVWWNEEIQKYDIIGGHHRFMAAKVLGFDDIPCIVLPEEFSKDRQQIQMVKWNMIKGRLNPEKFTLMYNDLATKYDKEALKYMMAFTDEDKFNQVYKIAKQSLPPEIAERLADTKEEIKTIDGLSDVLNNLFTAYGEDLKFNFINFSHGGQMHTMIRMNGKLKKQLEDMKEECREKDVDINDLFNELLTEEKAPDDETLIDKAKKENDKKQKSVKGTSK